MTIGALWLPSLGVAAGNPGAGTWTFTSAGSKIGQATATSVALAAVTPAVGDLMVLGAICRTTSAIATGFTITDTGSGSWNLAGATVSNTNNLSRTALYWKIATSADNNGGSGITVTITESGGSGTIICYGAAAIFHLTGGTVNGIDVYATANSEPSVTTLTATASVGATSPANTHALAVTFICLPGASSTFTGTNTYTGTSAAASLTRDLGTPGANVQNLQHATPVQGSATAASNVFTNTWGGATAASLIGATFVTN